MAHDKGVIDQEPDEQEAVERPRWRIVGPGLVVAATGIGAGDLVATMVAGSQYGYALLWAAVAGVIIKIALVEGAGRWTLATGRTIFDGWRSLGAWATVYFGIYVVVWGFSYGAAAMSATGLSLNALFPAVEVRWWGILAGVAGAALVWFGRYRFFENVMAFLVGVMFLTVVGSAVATVPNLGEVAAGLVPTIPEGGVIYTLGLAGGVGGTITLAAYGYWLAQKGWSTPRWMRASCGSTTPWRTSCRASSWSPCSSSVPSCCTPAASPSPTARRAWWTCPTCSPTATAASWRSSS